MTKPPVRIEVDATALRRQLREIGDAGLKKELASANKDAAQIVVKAALPNVPVRSGRLRRSVRALGSQREGKAKAGSAAVDYAAPIHWGRRRRGFIKSRPFLWNAAKDRRTQVVKAYEKSVDRLIRKLR